MPYTNPLIRTAFGLALVVVAGCAAAPAADTPAADPSDSVATAPVQRQDPLEAELQSLASQIAAGMQRKQKSQIAVVTFQDLDGSVSELGAFIAEEMITRLYQTGSFRVVEREMLNRVMEEHELSASGLVDESTAKELGKLLGVEAIATGTVTDLGDDVRVNSRLIATETGAVFAAAAVTLPVDQRVSNLMGRTLQRGPAAGRSGHVAGATRKRSAYKAGETFFQETFADYEQFDPAPAWGDDLVVKKEANGRSYLTSLVPGTHAAGQEVRFPENFSFEFVWSYFDGRIMGRSAPYVRIPFELIDSDGNIFLVECGNWGVKLPGLQLKDFNEARMNTFRLVKKGSTYSVYNNGQILAAGTYHDYGPFTGFRITIPVLGSGEGQLFTNFVGKALP